MSAIFAASATNVSSADAHPLRQYMWNFRPLVIFAPSSNNDDFVRQRMIVNRGLAGFQERNIVVVEVIGANVNSRLGPQSGATANALRTYYSVDGRQFRSILVGKDGGRKLRSGQAIRAQRLFGVIDSMPMRRIEMRRKP